MQTGKDISFYYGSGSVPSWKVFLTIVEKQLTEASTTMLSFSNKDHKSDQIIQLNPRGQFPTFKDGDAVVNESLAACLYLELTYAAQGCPLLPETPVERATVLQRTYEIESLYALSLKTFRSKIIDDQIKSKFIKECTLWNNHISDEFVVGNTFTLADISVFPTIAFLIRLGLSLNAYPNLSGYYERLKNRTSIKSTWPPHWETTPSPGILDDV